MALRHKFKTITPHSVMKHINHFIKSLNVWLQAVYFCQNYFCLLYQVYNKYGTVAIDNCCKEEFGMFGNTRLYTLHFIQQTTKWFQHIGCYFKNLACGVGVSKSKKKICYVIKCRVLRWISTHPLHNQSFVFGKLLVLITCNFVARSRRLAYAA